jgi:hypothetical protein
LLTYQYKAAREARTQPACYIMTHVIACLLTTRYVPNLVSGSFGECECGAKRADHTEAARAQGTGEAGAQGKVKRDSAEVRKGFVQREVSSTQ